MPELQRLVRTAADEAGGYRNLADRSGGLVSSSTLNNIVTGRHSGRLGDSTIRGVALAVGRPPAEVARILGTELVEEAPAFVLPRRANRLTEPQRRVVLAVIDTILRAGDSAVRRQRSTEARDETREAPVKRVARRRPTRR